MAWCSVPEGNLELFFFFGNLELDGQAPNFVKQRI